MTILAWLAVSSLVWGAVIWGAGRLLQGSGDVSGRARQWIWRGATVLLIAPWVAAPLVMAFGWGLAPTEVTPAVPAATLATLPVDQFTGEMLLDFTGAPAPAAIALDLTQMLLLVLAGGWIVRFVLAQYAAKSLLGIVAASRPAEKGAATVALAAWTKRLGLRRAPRLRIVNEAVSPFSFGVFRPVICLPEGLERELSREALDLVIGHECLHVARGDGWRRPLERIAADVFWFNPAAWLIRRELDVARELACDEGVVELSAARTAYARTLRDVAGFSAGLSHAAPAASMSLAGGRSLMLRVRRTLASAKRKPARAAVVAAVLIGLVGAPIAVAQVVFVVPAPPAPPAPPPAIAELPEPPEAPEAPAAAEIDTDGSVRATFAGKITMITGGKQNGFNVRLEGESEGAPCVADLNGLVSIDVAKGDAVTEGRLIGKHERGRNLRVSVSCTGGEQHSLAMPPAPPAMPAAVELAELATPPPAPAPLAAPAPKAAPSPALAPTPPSPPAPMAKPSALSPLPPVPMAPPVAPLSPQGIGHSIINAPNAVIEQSAVITSAFGVRADPFSNQTAFHAGVDLAAARGVTVHAPGNAIVLRAEKTQSAGNVVELRTAENYIVRFGQLDEIKVKAGEQVGAGAVVGTVGSSGVSTGPHLHMEVLVNGQPVDPAQVQGLKLTAG